MADTFSKRPKRAKRGPIRPWSAFKFRDYSLLWMSGIAMLLAQQLRLLASAQWLYEDAGSAVPLAILGVIQLVQIPVALYGGVLADLIDRKRLMALTQSVSFLSMLLLTLAAWSGALAPWMIYLVTGVTGIVNMLGNSARPAMLPRVVPRSHITNGVTLQTSSFQIGQIAAPLLFWFLFVRFGVAETFLVGTLFAGVSMIAPVLIRASGKPDPAMAGQKQMQSLIEGMRYVIRHPILPGLYLMDIGVTVVSFYRMLFPLFADQLYGLGPEGTALLASANALGGMAGSMLVFFTERVQHKGRLVLGATLMYAVGLFAFGLNPYLWVGLVIIGLLGATDAVGMTMRQAVVQLTTPDRLIGRASSAHSFSAMGANHLGQIEVALLAGVIGAGPTMVVGGAVAVVVVGLVFWLVPGVRRYRYSDAEDRDE